MRLRRFWAALGGALAVALPAAAEPALWKVSGPHATVYLFGTVHVLKPGTPWRTRKIMAAFNASQALFEEIKDGGDTAAMQPLVIRYGVDPAHPLSGKLDAAGKAKLAAVEASGNLNPAEMEIMRPWLASVRLELEPLKKSGYDPDAGADNVLKILAGEQRKPLEGFETLEQQIRFFADLPPALEIDLLLSALDDVDKGTGQLDQLAAAWADGDVARLESLLNADLKDKYPELYRILLVQRNKAFAAKIETLLKGEGTYFVAVGAAHLVGPDGVQADLARDGIKVVRQ